MDAAELDVYAIAEGGPLRKVERALRITRGDHRDTARRAGTALALAYVPFAAVVILWSHAKDAAAVTELLTHVRVLVALPLLVVAEREIEVRAGEVGRYLQSSGLVAPERVEAHRAVVASTSRLRDSWVIEIAILLVTLVGGFELPMFTREPNPVIRWSMAPSLVLYRFLALRLLWRWGLWALYFGRISRLPLSLRAAHPDRAAGLEPLAGPSVAFGIIVLAGASVLAAGWGDRMRFDGATVTMLGFDAVTYVVVALGCSLAPLSVFTIPLVWTRRHGAQIYGAMAKHYVDAFEARCLPRSGGDLLGEASIQSLNDLGGTFERVQTMRVIVAPRPVILTVVAAAVVPLLPLAVAEVGATTLLVRVAKHLF
jgi:hypothetical protein